jgi:hypothetical protein
MLRKVPKAVDDDRVTACYVSGGGRGGSGFEWVVGICCRVFRLIGAVIRAMSPGKKSLELSA